MEEIKRHYRHGGETTPQYHCPKCTHAHTKHSNIGKKHNKYIRKK